MKKTIPMFKNGLNAILSLCLMLLAAAMGVGSEVMMAAATNLPDAGNTTGGEGGISTPPEGIATETQGREEGDPDMYMKDVDQRITKIRPMATPVDQISRYAKAQHSDSMEVKYYSVGTRPVSCKTNSAVIAQASGASITLPVDDVNMFTLDDTIRVVGVKAKYDEKGAAYDPDSDLTPDLQLCVCGRDPSTSAPVVYAVNGNKDSHDATIWVPAIPNGTTLVRMGKACGELDVQTGRFNNLPSAEIQYCQNFMIQIEQSTFDKIAKKEVDWNFSDLEEDGIYDMRLAQENTYLFGAKNVIQHPTKDGMKTWFTKGIWWMAGKDIEVGQWDESKNCAVITDDNLVEIAKDLFVGTGIGNKRKILFCGSDMLEAFSKIKSDKFRLKDTVEVWNLQFKSWETDFGDILTIHHELFNENGMSDCAFALDPEYLSKKTHISWGRNVLDLKKAGIRNTNAVVLQEVSCLYLRYAKAHARMKLAQKPTPYVEIDDTNLEVAAGSTLQMMVKGIYPSTATVSWSSATGTVATINETTGVVTGILNGTSVITASITVDGNVYTDTATVTVTPSISLNKSTASVNKGSTTSLSATTIPDGETVTWDTSDHAVATVVDGTVTGVEVGTCNVVASFTKSGKTYTASCALTVNAAG